MGTPEPSSFQTMTSTSLLLGLRDPDNAEIWQSFVERYRPLILQFALHLGLGAEDAEDVAQISLLEFQQNYKEGKYDRDKGRLRSWLFGLVRRQILNYRRRLAGHEQQAHSRQEADALTELPAPDRMQELWEQEWQQAVLRACMDEIRREVQAQTLVAFEMFALQDRPAEEVAQHLGVSRNAVFLAKRRVLQRLRELRPLMNEIF
jgi:RNA polymerase sigma-70 factor (ECF subfamily)